MDFDEILAKILQLLQQEKRLSYRALKRRFALDDEYRRRQGRNHSGQTVGPRRGGSCPGLDGER